jgi:outer membrane protein assembly factor BamB
MVHLRNAFAVAMSCGLAASTVHAQFDSSVWPGFRGGAEKRGAVAAPGPALSLAFRKDNFATCTPGGFTVSASGDIYFKAYSPTTSRVYRLNPANGAVLGTSADFAGNTGNYAGVAVGVDALYTCNYNGAPNTSIIKLNKTTLATINEWTNAAFQGLRGTPLIGSVQNTAGHVNLYVADRNATKVHAVDSVTGTIQWSSDVLYAAIFGQIGPDVGSERQAVLRVFRERELRPGRGVPGQR